jgi:hypothetical protein
MRLQEFVVHCAALFPTLSSNPLDTLLRHVWRLRRPALPAAHSLMIGNSVVALAQVASCSHCTQQFV